MATTATTLRPPEIFWRSTVQIAKLKLPPNFPVYLLRSCTSSTSLKCTHSRIFCTGSHASSICDPPSTDGEHSPWLRHGADNHWSRRKTGPSSRAGQDSHKHCREESHRRIPRENSGTRQYMQLSKYISYVHVLGKETWSTLYANFKVAK